MADKPIAPEDSCTRAWWDATREGKLLVQRCGTCSAKQHYPRNICTNCGSTELVYDEASGDAVVYSHTTVMRAPHEAFTTPYVVAMVRLAEGPTLLTNIVGIDPELVRCDMPVSLVWEDLADGRKLPMFTPKG